MTKEEKAAELLKVRPMTRYELECKLGLGQQRVSEALRNLNACVVGHEPAQGRGRPAPIYSLDAQTNVRHDFAALTSVWGM